MMFVALLTFLSVAAFVQGKTKCYRKIGCVTNDPPYKNSTFPQSPESINTKFLLFTIKNNDSYQVISNRHLIRDLQESHYDCCRKSVFIIPGYLQSGDDPWLIDMCQTILKVDNVNCLCVDWSGGSKGDYLQAINNIQVVGGEIAFFIEITMESCMCSQSVIHLIGHGLGAHAAGEAGKRRPGIDRITCLDAARSGFEEASDEVSVDRSDAMFVVAIHTDAGWFGVGMTRLIGHKDFFPNGGKTMTGCDMALQKTGENGDHFNCNHVASRHMFIESIINSSGLVGYCASDYESFQKGAGFPCSNGSCNLMGYYTEPGDASSCRRYYLNTGPHGDYQRWRYRITTKAKDHGSFLSEKYKENADELHHVLGESTNGGKTFIKFIDNSIRAPKIQILLLTVILAYAQNVSITLMDGITATEYKYFGNPSEYLTPDLCLS